jgi:hypothetical protein
MVKKNTSAKEPFINECNALVTGVGALPDKTLLFDGDSVAKGNALQPLSDYVSAEEEVTTAEAAYRAAVAKAHAAKPAAQAMVGKLRSYLRSRLGQSNPALKTEFGVEPIQPRVTPIASRAAGAAKGKATKAAKKAALAATPAAATAPAKSAS